MRALTTRTVPGGELLRAGCACVRGAACSASRRGNRHRASCSRWRSSSGISMRATPSASNPRARARSWNWRLSAAECWRKAASWDATPDSIMSAMALPVALYSTAQVRALDAHAIESLGVSGYTLMKRAGEAALRYLRTRWPMAHRIVIVCGDGNNGGDGYVLARFAQAAGLTVTVLAARGRRNSCAGMRAQAYADFRASGGQRAPLCRRAPDGRGGHRRCAAGHRACAAACAPRRSPSSAPSTSSGRPVFALDLPSGLDGDAGTVLGRRGDARRGDRDLRRAEDRPVRR